MDENSTDDNMQGANAKTLHEGLTSLMKEIQELKQELKHDFTTFKEEFRADFRQEFNTFEEQIKGKLSVNNEEIQGRSKKLNRLNFV